MLWWAYFVVLMFGSAFVAKALGASIVAAIALEVVYPNEALASGVLLLYVAALVAAAFRD